MSEGFFMRTLRASREFEQSENFYVTLSYNGLMFYVYILQSLKDKSLYIGYTSDLRKRLPTHNKRQVVSTKDKAPWKLIYYEAYLEKKDATGREKFLKSGAGWRFIKKQLKHYFERNAKKNP
jgi:putative endonuclease